MKRDEILKRIGLNIAKDYHVRVLIDTDARNEADDQYAIIHHLLTTIEDVVGIVATHYEGKDRSGSSVDKSYIEAKKVLSLAEIDDIPVYKGLRGPIDENGNNDAEGVDFIIQEAKKEGKLYIAVQGAMSNVAAAILKDPTIAKNICVLWNGGGPYPKGRAEFNVMMDYKAVNVVLKSEAEIWQTPQNVYSTLEVSLAELKKKVYPCGKLGRYLYEELETESFKEYNPHFKIRTGENWCLGDNTTVAVLIQNQWRECFRFAPCRLVDEKGEYVEGSEGKVIKIFDSIDTRFTLEDLFAKLELAYGKEK